MPPWVRVGPSSITRTLLPFNLPGLSTVISDEAYNIVASGFVVLMFSFNRSISSLFAVLVLFIIRISALNRFASAG
jgi:hypothetical protein